MGGQHDAEGSPEVLGSEVRETGAPLRVREQSLHGQLADAKPTAAQPVADPVHRGEQGPTPPAAQRIEEKHRPALAVTTTAPVESELQGFNSTSDRHGRQHL
jgi:hypothetical protein